MSAARWERVRRLFEEASDLDPDGRRRLLADSPADLRDEVAALLEADARSDARWERTVSARREPAGGVTDEDSGAGALGPAIGDRVGAYRLVEEIGRGGMGRVLRAVRDDGLYRREVAVKLVQGPVDEERRRRFLREVRVLAELEHPHVARMYDGGVTDEGHPYVVMELVRGLPIDRHCEERTVSAAERVRMIAQVARAVDHAHRHRIVHRDLKPANVLVTAEGAPVLVDFGIAKLLGDIVRDDEEATRAGAGALTFAYASPEQLRSEPVTAAADVYSLGVVLYRLLTGRLPAPPGEVDGSEDRSAPAAPSPPSRVAGLRGLGRGAAADLDRVVLKALAAAPDRRYRAAGDFAEDLERVLARRPVSARDAGGAYRARRFVSRHRTATGVAAALLALLLTALAALAVSTVQARRQRDEARSEKLRAERLAELLEQIFEAASPATLPASELSARRLVAEASARLEAGLDGGDPATRADLYAALGRIQRRLGEFAESERLLRRAVSLREAAGGPMPELAADVADLAESVRENGDFPAAERVHRRALALLRAHYGEDALELTGSLDALSYVLTVLGHHDEARAVAEEALAIRERHLGPDHPEVADTLGKLGNLALTREDHRAAVDIFRRVVAADLDEINLLPAKKNLAVGLMRLGELDEAEALLREILAAEHRLYGEEHPRIAFSLSHLGEAMAARGRPEEAESYLRWALDMRRRLLGDDHPAVAVNLTRLADFLAEQGREDEAAVGYRRAAEIAREKFGPRSPYLADALFGLGRLLMARGDATPAEPLLDEALAIRRDVAPPARIAEAERELARCRSALGTEPVAGGG